MQIKRVAVITRFLPADRSRLMTNPIITPIDRFWNMKLPPLSRRQVRQIDQIAIDQYGLPGIVLMENAGSGAAQIIDRLALAGGLPSCVVAETTGATVT